MPAHVIAAKTQQGWLFCNYVFLCSPHDCKASRWYSKFAWDSLMQLGKYGQAAFLERWRCSLIFLSGWPLVLAEKWRFLRKGETNSFPYFILSGYASAHLGTMKEKSGSNHSFSFLQYVMQLQALVPLNIICNLLPLPQGSRVWSCIHHRLAHISRASLLIVSTSILQRIESASF